jgi:hypothetical protein
MILIPLLAVEGLNFSMGTSRISKSQMAIDFVGEIKFSANGGCFYAEKRFAEFLGNLGM